MRVNGDLESRLRSFAQAFRTGTSITPELHSRIIERTADGTAAPARRFPRQVGAAVLLVLFAAAVWVFIGRLRLAEPGLEGPPPPSGDNLIWYKTEPNRFVATYWNGHPAGSMRYELLGGVQSPDGSRIWLSNIVIDQSGHPVGKMEAGKPPFWADDSRHGCKIADFGGAPPGEGPSYLFTMEPSSQLRRVAEVGPNGVWNVEACSVTTDRAVVSRRTVSSVLEVDVIALTTGKVTSQYVMDANIPTVVASRDGLYLAEVHSSSALGSMGSTTIRQTTDGKVLATLDAEVRAFSWDSLRAVVFTRQVDGRGETRVINWLDGRVVWQRPFPSEWPASTGQSPLAGVLARPGNSELALQFRAGALSDPKEELWTIDNEGHARLVASGLITPAF